MTEPSDDELAQVADALDQIEDYDGLRDTFLRTVPTRVLERAAFITSEGGWEAVRAELARRDREGYDDGGRTLGRSA